MFSNDMALWLWNMYVTGGIILGVTTIILISVVWAIKKIKEKLDAAVNN